MNSHRQLSTNYNLFFKEKGEPKRYRTEVLPLQYQPNALPLGQTGSRVCIHTYCTHSVGSILLLRTIPLQTLVIRTGRPLTSTAAGPSGQRKSAWPNDRSMKPDTHRADHTTVTISVQWTVSAGAVVWRWILTPWHACCVKGDRLDAWRALRSIIGLRCVVNLGVPLAGVAFHTLGQCKTLFILLYIYIYIYILYIIKIWYIYIYIYIRMRVSWKSTSSLVLTSSFFYYFFLHLVNSTGSGWPQIFFWFFFSKWGQGH